MEQRRSFLGKAVGAAFGAGLTLAALTTWPLAALAGAGPSLWAEPQTCTAAPDSEPGDPCAADQALLTEQPFIGDGNIYAFPVSGGAINRMAFGDHANGKSVLDRAIFLGFYRSTVGLGNPSPPRRSVEDYQGTNFLAFDLPAAGGGSVGILLTSFARLETIVAPAIYGVGAVSPPQPAADKIWPTGTCDGASAGAPC